MATYYWVGGTGTWDQSSTANWRTTSGGATPAPAAPTSADNVIFDDNSGTGTVSIETAVCNDWTCTRTTGTNIITFGGSFKIDVYGSITWSNTTLTAISVTAAGGYIICYGASGTKTLNFGGKTAEVSLELKPSSSAVIYSLSSAANFGELRVQGGTFTTNNNAITIAIPNAYRDGSFTVDSGPLSQPITCNFGSSAISVANNVYFIAANGILTLNFGTSVITTVNSTTSVNFESSYTGAGTYAIDTTSTAGHAIRPNGDVYMVILGSVPVRLLLQQIGNTTGNTVNYFRIGGDLPAGSIVTLAGTTNCNDFLGQSGTVTFTGAVVVTNLFTADYNITLTCSSTLSAANIQLDSNNNILFSGVVTTTTGNINTTTRGTTTFNGVTCAGTFTSSDLVSTCGAITFNGTTTVNGAMTLAGGGLVTINGASTIFSFARSNGSLTLAAVTYTIRSSWYMQAGFTLTRSTSTIALSGLDLASAAIDTSFDSGGYTYQNVSIAGNLQTIQDTTGGSTALACAGTFTGTTLTNTYGVLNLTIDLSVTGALSLTGNSLVNRYFVRSNVYGTPRSITRASNTLTNVDFSDITFTGAAASGTSIGNCLGNTNITFTAAVNRFARASGDWSSTGVWSATSGGATGATAPLPQDTVIFNAASGSITVNTADRRALGVNLFTTGFNGTINVNNTGLRGSFIYGTIQTSTTTTITGTDAIIMAGRGALYNIEIRRAISVPVVVYGCNATYTVTNALSTTGAVSVTAGTFDLLANPLTCASLSTWYTPYSVFMPALSPDPSPITVNLNANTVTASGDISNDWQNYPNTPQSIATVNATNAAISAANIVFRYATFNTGTSNISLTGNIELSYPAATNSTTFTGSSNITFGAASSAFNSYTGTNITCNSITTASNFTLYSVGSASFSMNTLTLGGNLLYTRVSVASNISTTLAKTLISPTVSNNSLNIGGTISTFQDKAVLLTMYAPPSSLSPAQPFRVNLSYSGSAPALETNNFLYFFYVNVTSGSILAPAVADLGYNSGITFTGTVRRLGFSAYSGAITLPNDITPGAVMFAWGGGGQSTAGTGSYLAVTGGGSGAMAININVPLASGGTIYVSAPSSTGKNTVAGSTGATGGTSWVNLISNTTPTLATQGIAAQGGVGAGVSNNTAGQIAFGGLAAACIGDFSINGRPSGNFRLTVTSSMRFAGGTGGGSFFAAGGSLANSNPIDNNRAGTGGGGVYSAGTSFTSSSASSNGSAGGANINNVTATGGLGGNPPTAGASGTLGGGGAGGGSQTDPVISGGFTRLAGTDTATITAPNHGLANGSTNFFTLAYVTGTCNSGSYATNCTWTRPAGSTTLSVTSPSPHGITNGEIRYFNFFTGAVDGYYVCTVTGSNTLTIQTITGAATSGTNLEIYARVTAVTSTPHGLQTGDYPYFLLSPLGLGPYIPMNFPSSGGVTVINSTTFNFAANFGPLLTNFPITLGNGLVTTANTTYTISNVTTNTFDITTTRSDKIYALATCQIRSPIGYGGAGGDGTNVSSSYQLDYYNNVFYPSKYPIGLGGGGGGAGGIWNLNSGLIRTGTTGSGGDGGIAAGGGGVGASRPTSGTSLTSISGNGGAGGPGLIIIQYQVAQGSSQAGFVG